MLHILVGGEGGGVPFSTNQQKDMIPQLLSLTI